MIPHRPDVSKIGEKAVAFRENSACGRVEESAARWLSWLKRLTSNEEIPSSNLGRAFLFFNETRARCRLVAIIAKNKIQ